jgi:hypothetical protein
VRNGGQQNCHLLAVREEFRDNYSQRRDPIQTERLLWRAHSFRHLTHLLPGQSVLELGAGRGHFVSALLAISRGENPITALRFLPTEAPPFASPAVEWAEAEDLPGALEGRQFRFVVGRDLLDRRNCAWVLRKIFDLLEVGGQVILFESNPWNVVLKLRRALGGSDPRKLLSRPQIYELISDVGFIKTTIIYNDFVYSPLSRRLIWFLRNASILLENMPVVQTMAGSILISCQKGAAPLSRIPIPCEHECLKDAISVVIPCHNEEMNIDRLVRRLYDLYAPYLHEIVLVEDNSTDDTALVIRKLAAEMPFIKPVFRRPPGGVGRALMDGYRAATGKYVLSMDCDFTLLLPELRDLFDAAACGADVVVGSRFSRHSVLLNYPFLKILANRGFHVLAQVAFHRSFRDLTNNLKLMRRDVVDNLRLCEPGFAVNAETGLQPLLMGFSVKEVAISWINRAADMGASSFHLTKVGGGYWRVLARFAVQTRFGFRRLPRMAQTSSGLETDVAHS